MTNTTHTFTEKDKCKAIDVKKVTNGDEIYLELQEALKICPYSTELEELQRTIVSRQQLTSDNFIKVIRQ